MAEPIPDKGRVLTAMSAFWFEQLGRRRRQPPHLHRRWPTCPRRRAAPSWPGGSCCAAGPRCCPIECIVRGYLTGSAWKEYRGQRHHARRAAARRPAGGRPAARAGLHPVDQGRGRRHDENISFDAAVDLVGAELAEQARDVALELYAPAARRGPRRGDHHRRHQVRARAGRRRAGAGRRGAHPGLVALLAGRRLGARARRRRRSTSSRCATTSTTLDWDKQPPPPPLPADGRRPPPAPRYVEAYERITGRSLRRLARAPDGRVADAPRRCGDELAS